MTVTPSESVFASPLLTARAFLMGKSAEQVVDLVSGSSARLHANTKSCAVTGVPFDQTAFFRRRKVYSVNSALLLQSSATPGIMLPFWSKRVSPSKRLRMTSRELLSEAICGSRFFGSSVSE